MTSLGKVILANSKRIVSEWEEFAKSCLPAAAVMDLEDRRDHVEGMLQEIARDLDSPQTRREQAEKSRGEDDAEVDSDTAANAHGMDRAAKGTPRCRWSQSSAPSGRACFASGRRPRRS